MTALKQWHLPLYTIQGKNHCLHRQTGRQTRKTQQSKLSFRIYVCVCLLLFYILAISKVTSKDRYRLVTVCTHGDFYSIAPLGNQDTSTMSQFPTQSHYPDTNQSLPYPNNGLNSQWQTIALPIQPPRPVFYVRV